jgi:hypothetical protein
MRQNDAQKASCQWTSAGDFIKARNIPVSQRINSRLRFTFGFGQLST